ncbi:hypothetical protein NMG60_11004791 [Bertholletia excelsa]
MAAAAGTIAGGCGSSWIKLNEPNKKKRKNGRDGVFRVSVSASAVTDPYKTLRIQPGASESEVKKAFRQLALQYHPDVCRGSNCGNQFHLINEAYDIVMKNLRGESTGPEMETYEPNDAGTIEPMWGVREPDWDMWEEWMGWEGAGIRDYSSHINPYI